MSGEHEGGAGVQGELPLRLDLHRLLSVVAIVVVAAPATYLCLPLAPMALYLLVNLPEVLPAMLRWDSSSAWLAAPALGLWAMPVLWGVLLERGIFDNDVARRASLSMRAYILSAVAAGLLASMAPLSDPALYPLGTYVAVTCLLTTAHQAPFIRRRFFSRVDASDAPCRPSDAASS